ncbi:MAG: hypothetical protein GAK45_02105 [Pseudomonas citronellolis]|nr:MAG: hypothetical protein GAK45_02105 [Pseudomonas citronellolis]
MRHPPPCHGGKELVAIDQPQHGHPHRQRQFHLGIFLGGGVAEHVAHRHHHQHHLPAPEQELRQAVTDQAHLAGALHHEERGGEQHAGAECVDHQVGMHRSKPAESGPGQAEVQFWPDQLGGDEYPHAHADHAPEQGGQGELADDPIVVGSARVEHRTATAAHRAGDLLQNDGYPHCRSATTSAVTSGAAGRVQWGATSLERGLASHKQIKMHCRPGEFHISDASQERSVGRTVGSASASRAAEANANDRSSLPTQNRYCIPQ